jgi:hypothetical protein
MWRSDGGAGIFFTRCIRAIRTVRLSGKNRSQNENSFRVALQKVMFPVVERHEFKLAEEKHSSNSFASIVPLFHANRHLFRLIPRMRISYLWL